jgi:CHASE2 domain-containing sensor protein
MVKKSLTLNSLVGFLLALFLAGLSFQPDSWLENLERFSYGWTVRLTARQGQADPRIVLIDIDDMNIERMGSWPWPRVRIAEMIELLRERGVKVLGLNLPLFDRENNPGLSEVKSFMARFESYASSEKPTKVTAWVEENLQETVQRLDGDGLLVESVRKAGNIVFPFFTVLPPDQKKPPNMLAPLLAESTLKESAVPSSLVRDVEVKSLYLPFPELAQVALGFGHGMDALYGSGSGIANAAFISYRGSLLPSFPLRIAAAYSDLPPGKITAGENRIRMKDFDIPLWRGHQLIKFYRQGERFTKYTFADLLEGQDLPSLQGKIVLIGFNLQGGRKITTPLWEGVCENQFHACVLDNILNRAFVSRHRFLGYVEAFSILGFGALCAFFFPKMKGVGRLGGAAGLVVLALGTQAFVFSRCDVWVKTTSLAVAILAIYALTTIWRRFVSLKASRGSAETNRSLGS